MGSPAWEAAHRLRSPQPTEGWTLVAVDAIGIVVSSVTALLFMRGREGDRNIRGAFLHMAADALVSRGVVTGGVLQLRQGRGWIDPVMSLAIAGVIVVGTWSLFRQSLHLLFDGVPEASYRAAVRALLLAPPQVRDVHELHIRAMSTSQNALTAHLVLEDGDVDITAVPCAAEEELHEHFELRHLTLQLEPPGDAQRRGLRGSAGCGQRLTPAEASH